MRSPNDPIVRAAARDPNVLARFWASVDRGISAADCWECRDGRRQRSHPVFRVRHRAISAARLAWFAATGEFPLGGRIRHTCENTSCVRPDHLEWEVGRRSAQMLRAQTDGYVQVVAAGSVTPATYEDGLWRRAS
jgi:hypothetical protein